MKVRVTRARPSPRAEIALLLQPILRKHCIYNISPHIYMPRASSTASHFDAIILRNDANNRRKSVWSLE